MCIRDRYESIVANNISSNIFIFCVDEESYYLLKKIGIPKAIIIDFSNPDNTLLTQIKNERKLNEYCWTLKPIAILYIFENYPYINNVIYADGDIYFFADPLKLIIRIKKWSVILTTHKTVSYTHLDVYKRQVLSFLKHTNPPFAFLFIL